MTQLFSNNGSSTLLSGIGTSDTQLTVQAGDGAFFPAIGSTADYFVGTLEDISGNVEIVTCTAIAGDTITVIRGGEGTAQQVFAIDSRFELRVTKETLENFAQKAAGVFTGVITVPGIDMVTTDDTAHGAWETRYIELFGIPTLIHTAPGNEPSAIAWSSYKAANEQWSWGILGDGTQYGTGRMQWNWYGRESADATWNIMQTTTRPAAETMEMEWVPHASALNVSYMFEVVDENGVRRQIRLNADGSISATGDMTLSSVTYPLIDDPELEVINLNFSVQPIAFYGSQRVFNFGEQNFGDDAGEPGTGIAYHFSCRDPDGTNTDVWFTPDGSIWTSGFAVHQKVLVGDQGLPETLAPNELITKQYFDTHGNGGAITSNYFSQVLWEGVLSSDSTSAGLDLPLYVAVGPVTNFEQVIVETWFDSPWLNPGYMTMTIDTATLRIGVDYIQGPGQFHGDSDSGGTVLFRFTDYETIQLTNTEFGGQIRRVIGISYKGNPDP